MVAVTLYSVARILFAIFAVAFAVLHAAKQISKRLRSYESKFYSALIRFPRYVTGFNAAIAFPRQIKKKMYHKKGFLKVDYIVPASICVETEQKHTNSPKELRLTLGGILAIADSLTTLLIMVDDATHRPGVSVTLSGNMLPTGGSCSGGNGKGYATIRAGDTVGIACRTVKLGATLGFSEATFYVDDVPVAHVRHVKYLKMGFLYDSWIGPLLPLKVWARSFLNSDRSQRYAGASNPKSAAYKLLCQLAEEVRMPLADSLGLTPSASTSGSGSDNSSHRCTCTSHAGLQNPFGFLHGGAIACIAHDAVRYAISKSGTTVAKEAEADAVVVAAAEVVSMEVNYLAPGTGAVAVDVMPIMQAASLTGATIPSPAGGAVPPPSSTPTAVGTSGALLLSEELKSCELHELENLLVDKDMDTPLGTETGVDAVAPAASTNDRTAAHSSFVGKAFTVTDEVFSVLLKDSRTSSAGKSKGQQAKVYADCKVCVRCTTLQ